MGDAVTIQNGSLDADAIIAPMLDQKHPAALESPLQIEDSLHGEEPANGDVDPNTSALRSAVCEHGALPLR